MHRYIILLWIGVLAFSSSYSQSKKAGQKVQLLRFRKCFSFGLGLSFPQFSSVAQSCLTLCNPMDSSRPGFPVHCQLPELAETHVHRVGDATQPSQPLSSPSPLPSIFYSIRVFSNESVLHIRWPKYWSFSINPSNENSGLISSRIDWLDLLAVQGTLKSLLQHHNSKASILWNIAIEARKGKEIDFPLEFAEGTSSACIMTLP